MRRRCQKFFIGAGIAVLCLRILFLFTISTAPGSPIEKQNSDLKAELPDIPLLVKQQPMVCKANTSIHNFPNFTNEPQNMKNFLTYRHCKSFPRLLDSPLKCDGPVNSKEVFLLLAIKSSPVNYERREAIRRTWGAEKTYNGANVRRIFISGIPKPQKESNRIIQLLAIESKTYGDIVQWNFEDSFYNLTLKQVLFHQWLLESCPYAHFIFNGDDDIFLNTFNVLTYLQEFRDSGRDHPLFVGQLNTFMPPIRNKNSKYYVPEELFREEYFPPYCGGGGIIMSSFTAHSIFKESQHIPLFPIDDAYLGMCLQRAGLKPGNHEGIRTLGIKLPNSVDSFDPCIYRQMLMVHRFVPYEMLVMWKAVQVTNLECKKRSIKHGVYRKYNFTEQELGHGIV